MTTVVKGQGEAIQAIKAGQSRTAQRLNTIAAATGSVAVVDTDEVQTPSQVGKAAPKAHGDEAASAREARQKRNHGRPL
ncbi:hypothetical protein [Hymenobacter sp. AT01-02]|uniref:hypothetical protein n=1 Tax=Hymenobacter sp. AT01-02 TaxID=1571877 RepID=UPI0005F15B0E|nr:hypothetical protein [Hymenobacter sp. AT01-02]